MTNEGCGTQDRKTTTEACISEFNECSGNLLQLNLPTNFPSCSMEEAYTLWYCSARHMFINPEFVDHVHDGEIKIKSCHCGKIRLTMVGQTERLPLKEVVSVSTWADTGTLARSSSTIIQITISS
jgi:hypothetical protein